MLREHGRKKVLTNGYQVWYNKGVIKEADNATHTKVRNMNHEDAYYCDWIWLVPDEADTDELIDCALDEDFSMK